MPARKDDALNGRIGTLKLHLRYLHSVAANPKTINREIERRKAEVEKHLREIERLENTRDTVHTRIEAAQAELKNLVLRRNQESAVAKYIKLYREVHGANLKPKRK